MDVTNQVQIGDPTYLNLEYIFNKILIFFQKLFGGAFSTGIGFYFTGSAGAFDEGTRLSNCSTNGQAWGLSITGQDWGICTGCSFTTAPNGPMVTSGACNNWKFVGCEFATGVAPAQPGISLSSESNFFQFSGCLISNSTFGAIMGGTLHTVTGCQFNGNTNVDLYLSSTQHVNIMGSLFNSVGASQSILELTSNYSNINGNQANGTIALVGANSAQANNILY